MAQAYDAVIATIVVASDATQVTKAMVKSTTWRLGTSGTWNSTDCTLTAGNTYQFRTPNSGFDSTIIAVLPNIKASVTVAWDTSGTAISTVGNYFMAYYAYDCSSLTSLGVPDTSGLTSIGDYFMYVYATNCSSLTSLSVPDTSGLTSVGNYFMNSYANNCSNLTSLGAPNTSGLTSVGNYFMNSYAQNCFSLAFLGVPDTSGLTSVGRNFMLSYAQDCSSLTSLSAPDVSGLTSAGDLFMYGYAYDCSSLTSLGVPNTSGLTSVGRNFMRYYANNCSNLTSLGAPNTSGLTSVGDYFMNAYANYCSSLISLGIPDTSGLTSVGTSFMYAYASNCSSLTKLVLPSSTGWFETHNISWNVPSGRLGYLYGYVPSSTSETAWEALIATDKTLYLNYIRDTAHVVIAETNYSRESSSSLGSDDTDLATIFSSADYTTVGTDDDNYVHLEGIQEYFQFLFKEKHTNNTDNFVITWKGKSTLAPTVSTVYLQIYNRTTSTWTTLASNNTASANTKFTLESTISSNLSDYYDSNYVISARVYQDVIP